MCFDHVQMIVDKLFYRQIRFIKYLQKTIFRKKNKKKRGSCQLKNGYGYIINKFLLITYILYLMTHKQWLASLDFPFFIK